MNRSPFWIKVALILTLLLLVFGGGWFYHVQKDTLQQEMEANLSAVARLKVRQIAAWREDRLADAAVLMEDPGFIREVARLKANPDHEDGREIRAFFESLSKHYDYADIALVDPDGRVRLSLSGQTEVNGPCASALANALRDGKPVLTDLQREVQTAPARLFVIAPLFTGEKPNLKAVGAVILVCDASHYLYPLIQSWPTPSRTAETLLVRREGDEVLFLNDLRHRPDTALKLRIPLSRTNVPAVRAVLGFEGVMMGKDYRGVDVVSVLMPVPDSPWFMVAKMDTAEIFSAWRFRSVLILALLTGLTGFTIVLGLVFRQREQRRHYRELYRSELALRKSVERHSITLKAIGDAVIATDALGRVELLNSVAQTLTGWSDEEARGRPIEEIFRIINEYTRGEVENPVARVLREGITVGLANHTLLIAKDGVERPIADSGAPIRVDGDTITGVVLVFRDQSGERMVQRITQARLDLIEYAATHTLDELLTKALDDVGKFLESPIGFYHFVESGQEAFSLQQGVAEESCSAEGKGPCYGIDRTGAWADCVKEKKPVIRNENLGRGMTQGDAEVACELVAPVMREGKVVAILGVGNKPFDYTEKDADLLSYFADVTWEIVSRKRATEALQDSEKRYRRLFESAKDGILILDFETGRVVDANPYVMELLGYSYRELCGTHLWDIGCLKDIAASKAAFKTFQENEFIRYENLSLQSRGGQCMDVEFVSNVYPVDHTRVIQCNIRDLTERKREEKILRETEEFKKSILDSVSSHMAVLDRNGVILSVNEPWILFSFENNNSEGLPAHNSDVGVNYLSVCLESRGEFSEGSIAAHDGIVAVLNGALPSFSLEYPCHSPDVKRWFDMTVTPLGTGERGVVVSHTNITNRKLAEQEKALLEDQLRQTQKLEAIGTLAGGVAHDFNNILAIIIGYTEMSLMEKEEGSDEHGELMQVLQASNRAKDLVKQILAFSRRSVEEKRPVQVGLIVKEALKMLGATLPSTINISKKVTSRAVVMGDPTQIHQVLMNLCTNAAHAIQGEHGTLEVSLTDALLTPQEIPCPSDLQPGSYVELTVKDSGCGISPDIVGRIFDPFFTTKEKGVGTGLGLSVVYGIMKSHGGTITVESSAGEGTTFRAFFPSMMTEATAETARSGPLPRGQERVLVVDDEPTLAEATKKILERLGYHVAVRTNGVEALAAFRDQPRNTRFDLVITDMTMPHLTGIALAKELLRLEPDLPILLCTGFSEQTDAEKAERIGIKGFLMKPVVLKDLAAMVRKVLDEKIQGAARG
ncbi:MAG: PAS domain S-box protein [Syntrophobacteraceae bacterium]|nr:PAS domain S-box protein [Syntrophobacteraceae bacterium]